MTKCVDRNQSKEGITVMIRARERENETLGYWKNRKSKVFRR